MIGKMDDKVRATVARNLISQGKYVVVGLTQDPPTVLYPNLDQNDWVRVFTSLTHELDIGSPAGVHNIIKGFLVSHLDRSDAVTKGGDP